MSNDLQSRTRVTTTCPATGHHAPPRVLSPRRYRPAWRSEPSTAAENAPRPSVEEEA